MDTQKAFITALIKARSEFKNPAKDSAGQFPYASLNSVKNAIDGALKGNGFGYTFETIDKEGTVDRLVLIVEHSSGERRTSSYPLMISQSSGRQNEHQSYGSAQTYAMRNLLRTYFALDADDNDPDNRPSSPQQPSTPAWNPSPQPAPSRPAASPAGQQQIKSAGPIGSNFGNPNKPVSEKQVALINRLIRSSNSDQDEVLDRFGVDGVSGLNGHQASELISELKDKIGG